MGVFLCPSMKANDDSAAAKRQMVRERRFIGWVGVCLPVAVVASCLLIPDKPDGWASSMSITYHLSPVLTAGLSVVAFFLAFYEGYDRSDRVVNLVSAFSALLVAFVPCEADWASERIGVLQLPQSVSNVVHITSAIVLFGAMLANILVNFTKGANARANAYYRATAVLMGLMAVVEIVSRLTGGWLSMWVFECVYLMLFGFAWLVKGKMLEGVRGRLKVLRSAQPRNG